MTNEDSSEPTSGMGQASMSMELPRWKCHKEVHAMQIIDISERDNTGAATLFLADATHKGSIKVDGAFMTKHAPQPGGYFVVYNDGYRSFSPAEAFEDGYTRI